MRIGPRVVSAAAGLLAIAILWVGTRPASPSPHTPREDANHSTSASVSGSREDHARQAYSRLPITFIENQGQSDPRVRYMAQGARHAFFATRDGVVLSLMPAAPAPRGIALAWRFVGSNPEVTVSGGVPAGGEFNYINSGDATTWRTRVPGYAQIAYHELWRGVDLVLRGDAGSLKYEFRVKPHAATSAIRLAYEGATGLTTDRDGSLVISTAAGVLRDAAPESYQMVDGVRVRVDSRYMLLGPNDYGFGVDAGYDPDRELIIDPGLEYSTFLGGASNESITGIAVDAAGNAFVVGYTQSPNFPTTPGAFDRTGSASNNLDAFVAKLNPTGTALVYSTFIGAGNFEWGRAIAVDAAGNAYVAGQTKSSAFPTTSGAFDRTFNVDNCPRCGIDQEDGFVLKLNAAGSNLVYSTFLGGTQFDDAMAIAVDSAGNAYVAGETGSSNFPTTAGAFDRTPNGEFDTFVTKLNATGSALVYSTLLGGSFVDMPGDIAVGPGNTAYVVGATRSPNFPTTAGAFDTTANGEFDGFVTRLNAAGSALLYSTYLGGAGFDSAAGVAVDSAGNAYVVGGTPSLDFPTTPGAFDILLDGNDAFVAKLNAGGGLVFSTFLGGADFDGAAAVALGADGTIWLGGSTGSFDFPVTPDGIDLSFNGSVVDAFVAQLSPTGSQLLFSTYLGGTNNGEGVSGIALGAAGSVYVAGNTMSADFPTTTGAFDRTWSGDLSIFWVDGFVAKLSSAGTVPPDPGPLPPPQLASLVLNPTSVMSGNVSTATVSLTSGALSGGVTITLSSSNPSVANAFFPTTGIPAGQTSVPVGINTFGVSQSTAVTISASYNGVTVSGVLTVSPTAPPPPPPPPPTGSLPAPSLVSPQADGRFSPGAAVPFDWSDVAGAASYTIQIDNADTFTSPLTFTQTTTASQITVSALPTTRMWWRVRANGASGAAGSWSQVRRFELKQ